jgi:hypothetical protein
MTYITNEAGEAQKPWVTEMLGRGKKQELTVFFTILPGSGVL